jgi:hypothetical protein
LSTHEEKETVYMFSKETRERIDRLLQSLTLSETERYIVISQLETLVARSETSTK